MSLCMFCSPYMGIFSLHNVLTISIYIYIGFHLPIDFTWTLKPEQSVVKFYAGVVPSGKQAKEPLSVIPKL